MKIPALFTGTGGGQPDNFTLGVDVSIWNAEIDWSKITASGANSMDVYLRIWGYWL